MSKSLPKSEFELISWIRRHQGEDSSGGVLVGIGDDCAIVDFSPESFVLVTTDMLMDGRHFRLKDDGPEAVGYKAMGVNISDVAAMAGSPRFAVVSAFYATEEIEQRGIDFARRERSPSSAA